MFKIDYILKTENIVIDNGEKEPIRVSLSINQNDAEIYVVVDDMNTIEHYWFFDIEDYFGKYFDIRNVIDFAITKSNDVNDVLYQKINVQTSKKKLPNPDILNIEQGEIKVIFSF